MYETINKYMKKNVAAVKFKGLQSQPKVKDANQDIAVTYNAFNAFLQHGHDGWLQNLYDDNKSTLRETDIAGLMKKIRTKQQEDEANPQENKIDDNDSRLHPKLAQAKAYTALGMEIEENLKKQNICDPDAHTYGNQLSDIYLALRYARKVDWWSSDEFLNMFNEYKNYLNILVSLNKENLDSLNPVGLKLRKRAAKYKKVKGNENGVNSKLKKDIAEKIIEYTQKLERGLNGNEFHKITKHKQDDEKITQFDEDLCRLYGESKRNNSDEAFQKRYIDDLKKHCYETKYKKLDSKLVKEVLNTKKFEENDDSIKPNGLDSDKKFSNVRNAFNDLKAAYEEKKSNKKDANKVDDFYKKNLYIACRNYIESTGNYNIKELLNSDAKNNKYKKIYMNKYYKDGEFGLVHAGYFFGGNRTDFKIGLCLSIMDYLTSKEDYDVGYNISEERQNKFYTSKDVKEKYVYEDKKQKSGNFNTVNFVKNKSNGEEKIFRINKKMYDEKTSKEKKEKIRDTMKSDVFFYFLGELLCGKGQTIVPKTRMATCKKNSNNDDDNNLPESVEGLLMDKAEGISFDAYMNNNLKLENSVEGFKLNITPSAMADANEIGILDLIVYNRDRHAANYFVQISNKDNTDVIEKLFAIDNDMTLLSMSATSAVNWHYECAFKSSNNNVKKPDPQPNRPSEKATYKEKLKYNKDLALFHSQVFDYLRKEKGIIEFGGNLDESDYDEEDLDREALNEEKARELEKTIGIDDISTVNERLTGLGRCTKDKQRFGRDLNAVNLMCLETADKEHPLILRKNFRDKIKQSAKCIKFIKEENFDKKSLDDVYVEVANPKNLEKFKNLGFSKDEAIAFINMVRYDDIVPTRLCAVEDTLCRLEESGGIRFLEDFDKNEINKGIKLLETTDADGTTKFKNERYVSGFISVMIGHVIRRIALVKEKKEQKKKLNEFIIRSDNENEQRKAIEQVIEKLDSTINELESKQHALLDCLKNVENGVLKKKNDKK